MSNYTQTYKTTKFFEAQLPHMNVLVLYTLEYVKKCSINYQKSFWGWFLAILYFPKLSKNFYQGNQYRKFKKINQINQT